MENLEKSEEEGLALLCDRTGRIIDILYDGYGFIDLSNTHIIFDQLVDVESIHKLKNFFNELINQNMVYNWELNLQTHKQLSVLKFSGVALGQHYLVIAAASNYEMSRLLEKFISSTSQGDEQAQVLQKIIGLSCQQEQQDRTLFDKITLLNNELVNVQRELAKKNAELLLLNQTLEQRVEERTKKIQHLLQQKDNFIVQLGHDLKTPLGPIINLIPLILKQVHDDKLKQMVSTVDKSAKKLNNLVLKTMKYSLVTSDKFTLRSHKVQVFDLVEEYIEGNRDKISENGFEIHNNIDQNLVLHTDGRYLKDVFIELFGNSMKFSSSIKKIRVENRVEDDFVVFSITDSGIGFTDSQKEFVFDEFYKADDSRHDLYSHGLGLSIVKHIIEKLGGTIWVESKGWGKGSTFYFTLPKKGN